MEPKTGWNSTPSDPIKEDMLFDSSANKIPIQVLMDRLNKAEIRQRELESLLSQKVIVHKKTTFYTLKILIKMSDKG